MISETSHLIAADLLLFGHVLYVLFVVFGLIFILIGNHFDWQWVRNPWFRYCHLTAIAIVVVQSWLGVTCPITSLEMSLRANAGDATYAGSFIGYWLNQLLYYRAPEWVFMLLYTLFGGVVLLSWVYVPPDKFK